MEESSSAQSLRINRLLDDVFANDDSTFISFTSHAALISVILDAVGHPNPKFNLTTGQIVPALVRAEKVNGVRNTAGASPPVKVQTCPRCGAGN
jgi:hypothetical protein